MKNRDATLQAFYDLTETAILRRADACKNAGPAAKLVFDALRKNVGGDSSSAPERLPVCDALESAFHLASTSPAPIPELAIALNGLSPRLQWKRRNNSLPDGTNFHDGHANALVAGPGGLEEREDVWVGISLLAPHVRYPDHRHPPEEVYVSLAGGAWWNANMDWTTPGPSGLIYNEPNVLHAMRTEAQPLLAIWCLWVDSGGDCSMSASLKLLVILFWVVAFSIVATAQSAEEADFQTMYKKMFGEIEVSCETLLIAEYESDAFLEKGKPQIIAFDGAECARQLARTQFSTYLRPLFDGMALLGAELPLTEEKLTRETLTQREQRVKRTDEQMAFMHDELQKNIKPLVSLCRELGEKHNGEHNRVCFLGAPGNSTGRPFQALFQAMVENTQPPYETLCAPDPIHRTKSTAPELLGFLDTDEQTLSWTEVQKSLLKDKLSVMGRAISQDAHAV